MAKSSGRRGQGRGRGQPLVQSAARAVRLLRALFYAPDGQDLAELSEKLHLHKTTVYRLLHTLIAEDVVRRDTTGRYRYHPRVWMAAPSVFANILSTREAAEGMLRDLAQRAGGTAMLTFPDAARRRMTATLFGLAPTPLRLDPRAATPMPLHVTASGKCYLAGLPEAALAEYIRGGLEKVTPNSIVSARRLRAEIADVRRKGYALNREEAILGSAGIAVPVYDSAGAVAGALALAFAPHLLTAEAIRRWSRELRQLADRLSALLYSSGDQTGGHAADRAERGAAVSLRADSLHYRHGHGILPGPPQGGQHGVRPRESR